MEKAKASGGKKQWVKGGGVTICPRENREGKTRGHDLSRNTGIVRGWEEPIKQERGRAVGLGRNFLEVRGGDSSWFLIRVETKGHFISWAAYGD